MTKLISVILILMFAAVGAAFASGSKEQGATGTPEEPIELTYWAGASTALNNLFENDIIPNFEKNNPGIKIKYETSPSRELLTKLIPALAAGEGPELTSGNQQYYTPLVEQNLIYHIPDEIVNDQYMKDNYVPDADTGVSFGKRFAVPTGVMAPVIFVNQTMMEEAGIGQLGASWDEYLANAKPLAKWQGDTMDRAALSLLNEGIGYLLLGLVYQQKGEFFSDDGKTSYLDTPELLNSVKLGRRVYDDKLDQLGFPNGQQAFANEKSATTVQWTWYGSYLNANFPDVKWDAQFMPRFGDGSTGPYGRCNALSTIIFVTRQTEGAKINAAWKFWKYASLDRNADFAEAEGTVPQTKEGINAAWIDGRKDLVILRKQLLDPKGGYIFPVAVPQPLLDVLNNVVDGAGMTEQALSDAEIRKVLKEHEDQLNQHLSRRKYPFSPEA